MAAGRFMVGLVVWRSPWAWVPLYLRDCGAAWADSSSGDSRTSEPERQTDGGSQSRRRSPRHGAVRAERHRGRPRSPGDNVSPSPLAPNGYQRRWRHPRPRWGAPSSPTQMGMGRRDSAGGLSERPRRATCPDLHGCIDAPSRAWAERSPSTPTIRQVNSLSGIFFDADRLVPERKRIQHSRHRQNNGDSTSSLVAS